jgi:outer membrane protein assembly factor BamB
MKPNFLIPIFFIFIFLTGCLEAQEPEPTRWRGPSADGIYPDKELLKEWPAEGPEILWAYEGLGQGHSSAVATEEFIYTSGMIDGIGYVFKFDKSGELIYKKQYGPEYTESFYGTRGTPVIDGDKIYLISGNGILYCLFERVGMPMWTADLVNKYGGDTIRWGYNETPVIDGDVIYCTPGGEKNSVIALNRHDGSLIWSCSGEGELSAYCTPLLFTYKGRKILTTHTASHLLGIDAKTGKMLWSQSQPNKWSVHANTPLYHDGSIFYFSGYGQGSGKLDLNEDGTKIDLAWENKSMDSRMGGAVFVDGYIYGSGDNSRSWKCIDWKTGENTWEYQDIAKGTVIYADGMLYCYSERGELALVKANPAKFDLVSQTKVTLGTEQHWAHLMISDGVLYVRHGNALIAYKIK